MGSSRSSFHRNCFGIIMAPESMSLAIRDVVMFDDHNFMGNLPELLTAERSSSVVNRTPVMACIMKAVNECHGSGGCRFIDIMNRRSRPRVILCCGLYCGRQYTVILDGDVNSTLDGDVNSIPAEDCHHGGHR